jgi:hypothetical protein
MARLTTAKDPPQAFESRNRLTGGDGWQPRHLYRYLNIPHLNFAQPFV